MDFSCSIGNGNRIEGRSERYEGGTRCTVIGMQGVIKKRKMLV